MKKEESRLISKLTVEMMNEMARLSLIEGYSQVKIAQLINEEFGTTIGKSTVGDFLRGTYANHREFWQAFNEKPTFGAQLEAPEVRRKKLSGKRIVFAHAQNNTPIHDRFYAALKHFLKHKGAELIIGRSTYNKNGFQNLSDSNTEEVWYDRKIRDLIDAQSMQVADDLIFCGELNILPTAVNPLSGLHNYTKRASGIIPHTTISLETVPTHIDEPDKFLYTTGSITYPNYIEKKTGQKAEFHHAIGALYVEFDEDGEWHARHLAAESDTGCFYDLTEYFTPDGVEDHAGRSVEAINWGDIHAEKLAPEVAYNGFGIKQENGEWYDVGNDDSIMETLRPKQQFLHDTADFSIRNHHNVKDPHFRFKMMNDKTDCVKESLAGVANVINAMSRSWCTTVIVESNHDQALVKWLKNEDYRQDPVNAVFFLDRQLSYYKSLESGDRNYHIFQDTMESLCDELKNKDVVYLNDGDYYTLFPESDNPIQCGYHGHRGPNGARGSTRSFTKIGIRVNLGHAHAPLLYQNVACAGVSGKKRMGYNDSAPSSWAWSHIITYTNGKRIIITQKYQGNWRA